MKKRTVKSVNFYDENAELLDWLLRHTENFSDLVKVILYTAMNQANAPPAQNNGPSLADIERAVSAAIRRELEGRTISVKTTEVDADYELENNLADLF